MGCRAGFDAESLGHAHALPGILQRCWRNDGAVSGKEMVSAGEERRFGGSEEGSVGRDELIYKNLFFSKIILLLKHSFNNNAFD